MLLGCYIMRWYLRKEGQVKRKSFFNHMYSFSANDYWTVFCFIVLGVALLS